MVPNTAIIMALSQVTVSFGSPGYVIEMRVNRTTQPFPWHQALNAEQRKLHLKVFDRYLCTQGV